MSGGPGVRAAGRPRLARAAVAAALALAVLAAFAPAVRNGFVNYDDPQVLEDPVVRRGLTWDGLRWALTAVGTGNWHPLTWVSHLVDVELFGSWAGGHHAVSVALHAAGTATLFLLLRALTGAPWRSAVAAAVFGLHPLRVESVAWAAERKDVLSVLFGLLALAAWLRHLRRRAPGGCAAALALHAASLLSKPMLVTLPALMLLLDVWPLGRWLRSGANPPATAHGLALEKLPFAALSAAVAVVTFLVQDRGGAVGSAGQFPVPERIGNALIAFGAYIGKTFWPAGLAVFYPYDWLHVRWWQPALGAALAVGGLVAGILARRRRPALLVGWAWFAATLLPVIGIVQVGSQALADRYTYLPQVGVLLALLWGLAGPAVARAPVRAAALAAAPLALLALAAATRLQVTRWRDSTALFSHALRVTGENPVALAYLGYALVDAGRTAEGNELIARSFRAQPATRANAFEGAGDFYASLGRKRDAAAQYERALAIEPTKRRLREKLRQLGDLSGEPGSPPPPDPHRGEGVLDPYAEGNRLAASGRREEAVAAYREAIRTAPDDAEAWHNLGCALAELGRFEEAETSLGEALRLAPDHPLARRNLEAVRTGLLQRRGQVTLPGRGAAP